MEDEGRPLGYGVQVPFPNRPYAAAVKCCGSER